MQEATAKHNARPETLRDWLAILKTEGLEIALSALASVLRSDLTPIQRARYVRTLSDLPPDALAIAFSLAERDLKFFPVPAELRELAGIRAENATVDCDKAFRWVWSYIADHGAEGRDKKWLERDEQGNPTKLRLTAAPEIPRDIAYALEAMGGSIRRGLERFAETEAAALGFLRRDFDAAYLRGREVNR